MEINFNLYSERTRNTITKAFQISQQCTYLAIEAPVLMVALLQEGRDICDSLFGQLGIERLAFSQKVGTLLSGLRHGQAQQLALTNETQRVLLCSKELADEFQCNIVTLEFLFGAFALCNNPVKHVFQALSVSETGIKNAIRSFRNASDSNTPDNGSENDANLIGELRELHKYASDMNQDAEEGRIEPAIGRDQEIRRILEILSRKSKNNPVLVGEPGTGKTAIIEGLAHRINSREIPQEMLDLKIFSLDMSRLVAGASMQGEFEDRLKKIVDEVKDHPNVILFIDEIHLMIGAGGSNAMNAANILKPELSRGMINVIGATTPDEYRKYIESDKAFERRFQKVVVEEPDETSAIAIMRGIKSRYEHHHGIKILDEAIEASVTLSHRYITDRFLPDKAIDLLDEAASHMRIERSSVPQELDVLRQKIRTKEIERQALLEEESDNSGRIELLEQEITALRENGTALYARWQNSRQKMDQLQMMRDKQAELKVELQQARDQNRYREVVELERKVSAIERALDQALQEMDEDENFILKPWLDKEDIKKVVTQWTGIPMASMNEDENEKLLHIEETLHGTVIGQNKAIEAVAQVIRRNKMGLCDPGKPIGSFLFLGTTGVGKTELCKALAEYLFDSPDMMVRIDMSEYQQEHSVARLFGAPPGYVGYDQGGQLTEAIRRKPYSVILLDEIEKAHPKVYETLLQVLDDGRMTDGQGRVVNFKNTIIIMTSNIGQQIIAERLIETNPTQETIEETTKLAIAELKQRVAPEFINRIDETVMFLPLTKSDIRQIVELQLKRQVKKFEKNGFQVQYDEAALMFLTEKGYDPRYGGRPVKRAIIQYFVDDMTLAVLRGEVDKSRPIFVTTNGLGHLKFHN